MRLGVGDTVQIGQDRSARDDRRGGENGCGKTHPGGVSQWQHAGQTQRGGGGQNRPKRDTDKSELPY